MTDASEPRVEAVTFDFWNTVMWEEPGSLREQRLEVWGERSARRDAGLERAHDAAHRPTTRPGAPTGSFASRRPSPSCSTRLDGAPARCRRQLLVEGYSEAGRRAAVHPSDGVGACLRDAQGAGVRIGDRLRHRAHPLARGARAARARTGCSAASTAFAFSDEVGRYKPAPEIFEHALALGGVAPERAAHVGDRRRTDVGGARGDRA